MAGYIADLIPDGTTIQIGFGGLANAIGHLLLDKNDLGMHSEIVTPSVMELMNKGVINGSKKTFMPGKIVSAFAIGTQEFYDFINRNDDFYFKEIGWVNNPDIIAMNDNLISVNTALMIDLTGQVAAESIGTKQYSGSGGQVNFVHGARKSKGGRSIIALKSTYTNKEGTLYSKIVPTLPAGTIVTTSRNDVQYIVTEYGAVNLRYESIEKRTKKLISIAHPDFRDEMTFEAKKIGLI
jgi:4-hydroxybutyrate CoA-transferase